MPALPEEQAGIMWFALELERKAHQGRRRYQAPFQEGMERETAAEPPNFCSSPWIGPSSWIVPLTERLVNEEGPLSLGPSAAAMPRSCFVWDVKAVKELDTRVHRMLDPGHEAAQGRLRASVQPSYLD